MKVINEKAFDAEVLKSKLPVIVDFYADWCGPCKQLGATLEKMSPSIESKVKIVKINIDNDPSIATKYGIQSIPTLLAFKGGKLVKQQVGSLPETRLNSWIADL